MRRSVSLKVTRISLLVLRVILEPSVIGTAARPPIGVRYDGSAGLRYHAAATTASARLAANANGSRKRFLCADTVADISASLDARSSKYGESCQSSGDGTTPGATPAPRDLKRCMRCHAVS